MPLSRREARIIYKQCYLPTITYPLAATNMPIQDIHNSQAAVTSILLNHMGYSRNMPCCVVYAPESISGIGLRHLRFEQGVQQVLHLLRHLHAETTNGKLYAITIDRYQLTAGMSTPILADPRPLPWMPDRWITSIHQFLHITGSCIHLADSLDTTKSVPE